MRWELRRSRRVMGMAESEETRVDLGRLLAAVEESAPIDAVDVLAAELAEMVDASHVSLLIADFSGERGSPTVPRHQQQPTSQRPQRAG